mgnify:CR=1 FL=1
MSRAKRARKTLKALRYAEDYIEYYLLLRQRKQPDVEVRIEEESEEHIKLRIIRLTPDGQKVETTEVVKAPLKTPSLMILNPVRTASPRPPAQTYLPSGIPVKTLCGPELIMLPPKPKLPINIRVSIVDAGFIKPLPIRFPHISLVNSIWANIPERVSFPRPLRALARVRTDLLRLVETALPRFIVTLNVSTSVKPRLETLEKPRLITQQQIKTSISEELEDLHGLARAQQLRGFGVLDLLIPKWRDEARRLLEASGEYSGEPVIIILPEDGVGLWYLFWVACRELYREARGKNPEAVVLIGGDVNFWLRTDGRLSGKVVIMKGEDFQGADEGLWKRRLREAFSQGLGFLILITTMEDLTELESSIRGRCEPYKPRIVKLPTVPKIELLTQALAKLADIAFGIPVSKLGGEEILAAITPDEVVSCIDREYRDFIENMLSSNYMAWVRRDVGERESEDHVAMKALVVKYLHEELGIELEKIKCTCEVGKEVIADIYVEDKALSIECETLLGTAPAPILKVFESSRKYLGRLIKPVNEVWVVIRNWPAVLHLGDLYWAEKVLQREFKRNGKTIKFFIPDIYKRTLKPLDEVVRQLRSIRPRLREKPKEEQKEEIRIVEGVNVIKPEKIH